MKCLGVPALRKMFQRADKVMLWVEGVKSPSNAKICHFPYAQASKSGLYKKEADAGGFQIMNQ